MKELIIENGTVVGVESVTTLERIALKQNSESSKQIGYGNNADLLPAITRRDYSMVGFSMGEGLEMAKRDVNANTTHIEYIKNIRNGVETSPKH